MRIALDATPLIAPSGGQARYVTELALALARAMPEDEIHLLSDQTDLFVDERLRATANVRLEPPRGPGRSKWWSVGLPLELRRRGVDVFHGADFAVPYLAFTPAVMTLHDLSPWKPPPLRPPGSERVRRRTPWLLRLARRVITPTEAIRREAIAAFRLSPDRVRAIPHAPSDALAPLDPAKAAAVRAELGLPPRYLMALGAGNERKNIGCLVAAWRQCRLEHPTLGLAIVGAGAGAHGPAEGLLSFERATDEQTAALLSGAAAFVYPSLYEGFGLPLLEAMRAGAPVIASADPALAEVAGEAAWLLDASSPQAWASAILKLLAEPAAAERLRRLGRQRAAERTWAKTAAATRETYEQAIDNAEPALLLSPEAPYPLAGAARCARPVCWDTAERRPVHLVRFSEEEGTDPRRSLPAGLVAEATSIVLPHHRKGVAARSLRNGWRLARGRPPLLDRFSQPETLRKIAAVTESKRYSLAVVEHFWCAEAAPILRRRADRIVLDLHNVESVLHDRCGRSEPWPQNWAHKVFCRHAERAERALFPQFDLILTASRVDAERVLGICPKARVAVYPNALPLRPVPRPRRESEREVIAFSGNLEYHPNITAVKFSRTRIWPEFRDRRPNLVWKVIGKNEHVLRRWLSDDPRIELTGAVEDALEELAAARLAVVPILAGSGTRVKIMEAWAAGRAVVSTRLGAEGLPAEDGVNIALAEDPRQWLETVVRLLEDDASRARLGAAGRDVFERELCWPAAWAQLDLALEPYIAPTGVAAAW